jgi:four helix bundle protein
MMPYEKFEAWKVTHELALEVYRITEQWPKAERYELTSQTRRAALSAPTNIADGAAKRVSVNSVDISTSRWDRCRSFRISSDSAEIGGF